MLHELHKKGLIGFDDALSCGSVPSLLPEVAEQLEQKRHTNPLDVTRLPMSSGKQLSRSGQYKLYGEEEIEQVLELVEYFKRTHNYMSAIHVLRKALYVSPTVGEFYRQLALLHARFKRDMQRAYKAIDCAIQLDPGNASFKLTRDYLQNFERLVEA